MSIRSERSKVKNEIIQFHQYVENSAEDCFSKEHTVKYEGSTYSVLTERTIHNITSYNAGGRLAYPYAIYQRCPGRIILGIFMHSYSADRIIINNIKNDGVNYNDTINTAYVFGLTSINSLSILSTSSTFVPRSYSGGIEAILEKGIDILTPGVCRRLNHRGTIRPCEIQNLPFNVSDLCKTIKYLNL